MQRILAAAIVTVTSFCASFAETQDSKGPPARSQTLEELQREALKGNSDVKVAEAKLKLAQEKLDRARAKVKADVETAFADLEAAKAGSLEGKERYVRARKLYKERGIALEDLGMAKLTSQKLEADVAAKEARLNAVLGREAKAKSAPPKN
jgi:multidrug resistance efflux pump